MHTMIRRVRHERDLEHNPNNEHPTFSQGTWAAIGVGVVGAGVSLYGANKQSQAQKDANAANQASVGKADQSAWVNYLLQRGLAVDPNTPTGSIPSNARAVNQRLPLWANMSSFGNAAQQSKDGGFLKARA